MEKSLVERRSGWLHYYVRPSAPSSILFEKETLEKLNNAGCDLSVTAISQHIRETNDFYFPVLLTWEMTSRCNFNCPFCYIKNNNIENEITFHDVKDTLDLLVNEGLFEVYLSGGECLLIKDFLNIYRYLKEKGVFVTVFTNGSLIDDTILECWKELPPNSVEITLYNDDYSSKPYQNILRLHELGIYVLVKFTLTNTTKKYFESVKKWIYENNLPFNVDASLYDGIDQMHSGIKDKYSVSSEQKRKLLSQNKVKYNEKKVIRTALPCKSKKGIIQISPDFSISLCNKMKTRWDLKRVEPTVALNELRALIAKYEKKVLHGCKGCVYSQNCNMCIVSADCIDDEFFVPKGYCNSVQKMSLEET